jgi:hypothetical protein
VPGRAGSWPTSAAPVLSSGIEAREVVDGGRCGGVDDDRGVSGDVVDKRGLFPLVTPQQICLAVPPYSLSGLLLQVESTALKKRV